MGWQELFCFFEQGSAAVFPKKYTFILPHQGKPPWARVCVPCPPPLQHQGGGDFPQRQPVRGGEAENRQPPARSDKGRGTAEQKPITQAGEERRVSWALKTPKTSEASWEDALSGTLKAKGGRVGSPLLCASSSLTLPPWSPIPVVHVRSDSALLNRETLCTIWDILTLLCLWHLISNNAW